MAAEYFVNSGKLLPKYDIYEKSNCLEDEDNSRNCFINKETTKTGKMKSKFIYHSTPLDSNIPHLKSFSNLTSISKDSSPNYQMEVIETSVSSENYIKSKSIGSSENRTRGQNIGAKTPCTSRMGDEPHKGSRSTGSWQRTPGSRLLKTPGSGLLKTPGSTRSWGNVVRPTTIVAIVEGRGHARRQIGIAALNLIRPELSLVQFSDTHTYTRALTELSLLNPLEVVFASTAEDERLMRVVREGLETVAITTVHRKYFNESRGLAIVKHLALPQCDQLERQISVKYYCLSAAAALVRYVEQVQNVTYAPKTLMIKLSSSESVLTIDIWSSRKLELVRNISKGWEYSLFGAIRYTTTPSGSRLLRASLLQPFADTAIIETRLEALEYLTRNPELFYSLKSILGRFPDLDWILSMCVQKPKEDTESRMEQRLNYIIGLKNTLDLLNPLKLALENADNIFFNSVKNSFSGQSIDELLTLLKEVLHEDARLLKGSASMRTQRCYAIKPNVNGLLDVARKIYSEIVDDITSLVESLTETHKLPLKVGHNASRGFHIIIPVGKKGPRPQLPDTFIQVQESRGSVTCTTEVLYQMDQRSKDALREILLMSNVIIQELMAEIRERVGALFGVTEAVASLDMVIGLAHAASLGSWVRPTFATHWDIRRGRHPILDLLSSASVVPNDTLINEEKRAIVISGPNMSGKSTYLRQVALIQILAQIGSFVPAEYATLKLVHHLYTLFGCEDSPENCASTFQVQMSEVSIALEMAGPRSLILLDELAHGTSLDEGRSIAWAIMEGFLLSGSSIILATHILTLTALPDTYPQITNYYMKSTIDENDKFHFTYELTKGKNEAKNYGLCLASSTPLPKPIIPRAHDLANQMENSQKISLHLNPKSGEANEGVYLLAHKLLAFTADSLHHFEVNREEFLSIDAENNLKSELKSMLEQFLKDQNN